MTRPPKATWHFTMSDTSVDNSGPSARLPSAIQHATSSKGGANPEIRCLLFKLFNLSELPIIPLFMFDGRQRPKVKRGSKKGKSGSHNLSQKMKEMLDICGMEWRVVRLSPFLFSSLLG